MDYTSYTYIVPIPYGSTVKNKKPQLTLPSQLVIQTAFSLYKQGKTILLCGEESFDKKVFDEPVTTHLMKAFLQTKNVTSDDSIAIGTTNKNTVEQIQAIASFQKKHDLLQTPFLLLCLPYHQKRLQIHAKAYGLNAKIVPINFIDPSVVTAETKPLFQEDFEATEKISRLLSAIDTKGYYSLFFTWLSGPRIVDMVQGKPNILLGRTVGKKL